MKIKLNNDIEMDLATLVKSRLFIQANSGGGKSHTTRRILEQTHKHIQHIILDPEGEFSTLREKYEYILVGQDGDVAIDIKSADKLARKLLEFKTSAIIDLFELLPRDRKMFVKVFLEAMVHSKKELWHPCLVVVDEAHTFAPEKGNSVALDAMIAMASLGRKREFCLIPATQRISKLHKDVAAECNNKLIGRTSLDIDQKRAADELGLSSKEEIRSLRNLDEGEFYAYGPAISRDVIKLKIGGVNTKPPKTGNQSGIVLKPTAKMKGILAKLADLPMVAAEEERTIENLTAEVLSLRQHKCPINKVDPREIDNLIKRALLEREREYDTERQQMITVSGKYIQMIKEIGETVGKALAIKNSYIGKRGGIEGNFKNELFGNGNPVEVKIQNNPEEISKRVPEIPKEVLKHGYVGQFDIVSDTPTEAGTISSSEQRILDAIAWFEAIGIKTPNTTAVAYMAGYRLGGRFNNLRSSLKIAGLIEYQQGSTLSLTDYGRQLAHFDFYSSQSNTDLHNKVLEKIPTSEGTVLKVLLVAYPEAVSNEILAEQSGYSIGGRFNNVRSRLKSLGLITYTPSGPRAEDFLFF